MTTETALIFIFILNAFAIIGFNRATEYDSMSDDSYIYNKSVLWFVRYWSIDTFGEYWSKPICTCCKCMATIHGIYFYAFFYLMFADGNTLWLWFYPMYWFALSGFAHALNLKISKDENE